jgi:hypothetical protein
MNDKNTLLCELVTLVWISLPTLNFSKTTDDEVDTDNTEPTLNKLIPTMPPLSDLMFNNSSPVESRPEVDVMLPSSSST